MITKLEKRDGRIMQFDISKIEIAIQKACKSVSTENKNPYAKPLDAKDMAKNVKQYLNGMYADRDTVAVEEVQDAVEHCLVHFNYPEVAKEYILYRNDRNRVRDMNSNLMKLFNEMTYLDSADIDVKRENTNIDGDSAMGTMLKYGSESAKAYNLLYQLDKSIAEAHRNGDIHIHDLDFYTLTETCMQIPLNKLFKDGFSTGTGFLRAPGEIRSYAALTAIAIQSDQNDQHGGQSIPCLDFYLAPGVAKTFIKELTHIFNFMCPNVNQNIVKIELNKIYKRHGTIYKDKTGEVSLLLEGLCRDENFTAKCIKEAEERTEEATYQAMEALIGNLNTMHSRAGAQVPFSSLNYGTDTSEEGRLVIKSILRTTDEGLGMGETPIFPIQIFKLRSGVSANPGDPNYDLFVEACKVSAKRMYPNFSNLDVDYNAQYYKEGRPETEVAYMGCRTRVIANEYDKSKEVAPGRGNLSFTSINLPRLALLAKHDLNKFYKLLDEKMELVHKQLLDRFEVQCRRHPKNYPFLMGQGIWLGSDKLYADDDIREILKHGTLSIGFIGLAETLVALVGKHHGESEESQKLGLEIIGHMRSLTDKWCKDEKMNYSIFATPAEGLSGRFVKLDKKLFGIISGVTDREYYTNSTHVPVYYDIDFGKKVAIEAPYHRLCNGGHIAYVEVDADLVQNVAAFVSIIQYMRQQGCGYMAINHPVDRDPVCKYVGVIGDVCPRCGRREGEPMTEEMWKRVRKSGGIKVKGL